MPDMVAAGVGVAAVAATCFEVSYLLQALEARRVAPGGRPGGILAALARRRRWLAGLALAGAGAALQIVALRLAPLTAVQPALALGLVFLVAVGGRVLGEPAGPADLAAAVAVAGGVALLGLAGSELEPGHASRAGTVAALVVLGLPVLTAHLRRAAPAAHLLAAACTGDALVAIGAKRLADALGSGSWWVVAAWLVVVAAAAIGALSAEMAVLGTWPATRVGPLVAVCQTAIPVLLAPVIAGEQWGGEAGLVLGGLVVVVLGGSRLARSARLLERREPVQEHVGGGG
jgi:hypothetical protein